MNTNESNAFEESMALNRITLDLLNQKKKEHLRLWIVIIIMVLVNLIEVGMFIWYESQFDVSNVNTEKSYQNLKNSCNIVLVSA